METDLYFDISPKQWPIIYRDEYNVHFLGLEKLHPFDAGKWGNIFQYLITSGLVDEDTIVEPNEATKADLLVVHTKKYLKSLHCSFNAAKIAEIPPLCIVPNFLVQRGYLRPMRYQTGGSILAGKLALERGWSINIGGGFHHCSAGKGGGFCPYADITLLVQFLFNHYPYLVKKVMVVDLDAHQGNGYEHDFIGNNRVHIFDAYNKDIYPHDRVAKCAIMTKIEFPSYTSDNEYLYTIRKELEQALSTFNPDLVVYNAGTDVLKGDSLGRLSISSQGIVNRDELVFRKVRMRNIPIVMLTSGGYLKKSAKVISSSILNLHSNNLISGPVVKY